MRVLIVEEHAERERLALRFLQWYLERAGHETFLSNTWNIEKDYMRFAPDLVVDNLSESVGHFIGKWSALGEQHRNVNLIWEQVINPLSLYRFRFDKALSSTLVDGRITWGNAARDILLRENPDMDGTRVHACGSMKHAVYTFYSDLPRERLLPMYPAKFAQFEKKVLFVDSYPAARRAPERDRAGKGTLALPYMYEVVLYLQELKTRAFELLERLAKQHSDWLFILRLHPNKDPNYYDEFRKYEAYPNVVVNAGGDIGPLLHLSDLVIAGRSGALLDNHFVGRPGVNLVLSDHPFRRAGVVPTMEEQFGAQFPVDRPYDVTVDELLERGRHAALDLGAVVDAWFAAQGERSFHNVVRALERTMEAPGLPKKLAAARYADRYVAKRLVRNRLRLIGLGRTGSKPSQSFDYEAVFELLKHQVLRRETAAEAHREGAQAAIP